jgi:hypothetical protein
MPFKPCLARRRCGCKWSISKLMMDRFTCQRCGRTPICSVHSDKDNTHTCIGCATVEYVDKKTVRLDPSPPQTKGLEERLR